MSINPEAPAIVNLLDVRTWADATQIQIGRVRQAWRDGYRRGVDLHDENIDAATIEVVNIDAYFLVLAAHQLVKARGQPLDVDLPRLSPRHEQAIKALRTIREHYPGRHRDAFFGGTATSSAAKLKALNEDAHPWGVSGSVAPVAGRRMVVAGVLPLDDLEAEVQAMLTAAESAIAALQARLLNEQASTADE